MPGRGKTQLLALAAALFFLAAIARAQDAPSGLADQPAPPPPPPAPIVPPIPAMLSPVIWAENPDMVQRFSVNGLLARQMVDTCLLKLTSAPNLAVAWTRLGITSRDVVGIKITTTGGPLLSTHHSIVQAICEGLELAGVAPSNIIIWDKNASDMRSAGYAPTSLTDNRVHIASVFPGTGYDPDAAYKNGILGTLIWGDSQFANSADDLSDAASSAVQKKGFGDDGSSGPWGSNAGNGLTSNRSYFARLVTTICTKIVNVPVLTDNAYVGIDGCMASLALGSVDNNRRLQGDPSYGDPAIAEILSKDYLRRKVVVHILDALVSQYAGGPRFDPQFTRQIGAIYVSRDPVAIDALALRRLEQFRAADRQGRIDPIGKTASHVHSATTFDLGTDDPSRIQLVRVP